MRVDDTDRNIIAALEKDGRARITNIAATLGITRATVQARIDRMMADGVIRRFSVEVDPVITTDRIRAVMLIKLKGNLAKPVIRTLRSNPHIASLHTTNGNWDLVANLEVSTLPEFDRVLTVVRELDGIQDSETCLLLNKATT